MNTIVLAAIIVAVAVCVVSAAMVLIAKKMNADVAEFDSSKTTDSDTLAVPQNDDTSDSVLMMQEHDDSDTFKSTTLSSGSLEPVF